MWCFILKTENFTLEMLFWCKKRMCKKWTHARTHSNIVWQYSLFFGMFGTLTQLKVMLTFVLVEIYSDGILRALNEMNSIGEPVESVRMWSDFPHVRDVHHFWFDHTAATTRKQMKKVIWIPLDRNKWERMKWSLIIIKSHFKKRYQKCCDVHSIEQRKTKSNRI